MKHWTRRLKNLDVIRWDRWKRKKKLVAQQLDNRLTQIVLRQAVEGIEIKNTSARKM